MAGTPAKMAELNALFLESIMSRAQNGLLKRPMPGHFRRLDVWRLASRRPGYESIPVEDVAGTTSKRRQTYEMRLALLAPGRLEALFSFGFLFKYA